MRSLRASLIAAPFVLAGLLAASSAVPSYAPAASCADGPAAIGDTIWGTPCDDVIRVPASVTTVHGGGGDDRIVAAPIGATTDCPQGCYLGVGSQTFEGGPGNDVVFGGRGNDELSGGEGDDRLYGGIGDDLLRGGPGDDLLSGGFGFDSIDGEAGDDYVRSDGTIDEVADGGGGSDTLSYATGVTPGFTRGTGVTGFPSSSGERGVYLDLATGLGDNGVAPSGGGVDEIEVGSFETVIGTPFSDYIAGSSANETIYGGGGADAILGGEGDDTLHGGADGDYLDGGPGEDDLDAGPGDGGSAIELRDASAVSVGFEAPEEPGLTQLYLTGSSADDEVTATYSPGPPAGVSFELASPASFDQVPAGCELSAPGQMVCTPAAPLDALVLAGMGGDDALSVSGFPMSTSVVALGGAGDDSLDGGSGEDMLVDGPGEDVLSALAGDDALLNNAGDDALDGGVGNDLLLSNSICDGDVLNGGADSDRDNASWSKLGEPVEARIGAGVAGRPGGAGPGCSGGTLDQLLAIEDLEGTSSGDFFYGSSGNNQLLGRLGADTYFGLAGDDTILANSGDEDLVIDCGEGAADSALIDRLPIVDPAPVGCEAVNNADPNDFEPPPVLPEEPVLEPPVVRDRKPPATRLRRRPGKVVFTRSRLRRVVFAFASDERGATFRCRLDRARFSVCASPRAYRLPAGRHVVSVYAVDAAGNRDPTPASTRFRIRRR
jgi:Ca2+-binding RTX toxin-like protein